MAFASTHRLNSFSSGISQQINTHFSMCTETSTNARKDQSSCKNSHPYFDNLRRQLGKINPNNHMLLRRVAIGQNSEWRCRRICLPRQKLTVYIIRVNLLIQKRTYHTRHKISRATLFSTLLEFYKQVKGWADEYQADGLFCVWLAHKPVVAIFKPEHVEVQCFNLKVKVSVGTSDT